MVLLLTDKMGAYSRLLLRGTISANVDGNHYRKGGTADVDGGIDGPPKEG